MGTDQANGRSAYMANDREIEIPNVAISKANDAPAAASPVVDLAAWARGEEDHECADVLQAIEEKIFHRVYTLVVARAGNIRDLREALAWCVKECLIREREQRDDL
jgi:hypothetical protein